ncbi:hypothetical protein GCM10007977_042890 [Dactylosporangium sucinum]|uniref:Nitrile hydratase beta subunit-like N-terminal domain-containing protein n=2 Tax=Dactylosporangium sucinum TaxID=1424081 RepID=A0A917WX48_9ACTN|nr:hypothetical protein GCM10007977_042890 [Dactylosporangium sucinum]
MVALANNGHTPWRAFQQRLAEEIEKAGNSVENTADTEDAYFDCWLAAAERTLVEEGFVARRDMDERIDLIRAALADPAVDPAANPTRDQ